MTFDVPTLKVAMREAVLQQVVQKLAQRIADELYPEIVAKVSQEALATLVLAQAASRVREAFDKDGRYVPPGRP